MKKEIVVGGALLMALLLAGAGCTDNSDNNTSDNGANPSVNTETQTTTGENPTATVNSTTSTSEITTPSDSNITLVAALDGDKTVRLSWETARTLNDSHRFIIVRGRTENPEHTSKNFWERVNYDKKEFVWANQPVGTYHYRVCLTENNNNDVCTVYSNDVTVEVK